MYGCESWTVKKAECQRIDAFELWCWRKLLRVPWTARRSNQSILKEISPGCLLEGVVLKLKLQYFGHLMQRVDSLEKTLMLGGIGGRRKGDDRRWDGWMASPTQWTWVWVNSGSWWWTRRPGVLWFMELQRVRHDWETELNWTNAVYFYSKSKLLKSGYFIFIFHDIPGNLSKKHKIVPFTILWDNSGSKCLCPGLHSAFLGCTLPELLMQPQFLEWRSTVVLPLFANMY